MIDIIPWMDTFCQKLRHLFADRLEFVGLQGSYARGEATDSSDIDVVVIMDTLTVSDLLHYRAMLDTLPHRELVCGFVSGKEELLHWEPADLVSFCFDTTPILGRLDELQAKIQPDAVRRAIRLGAGNIYHACVHNLIHEQNMAIIKDLYKAAVFVIQAMYYLKTGIYIRQTNQLKQVSDASEKRLLALAQSVKAGTAPEPLEQLSESLLQWTQQVLSAYA